MKTVSNRGLRKAVVEHRAEAERINQAQLNAFQRIMGAQADLTRRVSELEAWRGLGLWGRLWYLLTGHHG